MMECNECEKCKILTAPTTTENKNLSCGMIEK